jgi:hypothetical protein
MASPSSDENTPVIKSRTGKFLQNVFDKKTANSTGQATPTGELNDLLGELMQVVPEQTKWHDDEEESNWDDDFVEAPQPPFVVSEPSQSPVAATPVPAAPPPPPSLIPAVPTIADTSATIFDDVNKLLELDPAIETPSAPPEPLATPVPPIPTPTPKAPPKNAAAQNSEVLEVSIPRPKNIKYKSKDPNQEPEPLTTKSDKSNKSDKSKSDKSESIELNIKRPTGIKYKAKPPEDAPTGLPAKLLGMVKSIKLPGLPTWSFPKFQLPNAPNLKLPLGDNLQRIVTIGAAIFLSVVTAWAAINFWPRSVAAPTPTAIVQPVSPPTSPEAELIKAVQSRLQTLAGLYPAGLITNLELDAQKGLATITVSDLWRSLTTDQQQQTAQSLWQQAVTYQMAKLEVRSSTDQLLARSPIVGGEAIVINP